MEIIYRIALLKLKGVGNITARLLVDYFGSAKTIFESDYKDLKIVPGIGKTLLNQLSDKKRKQDAINLSRREFDWYHQKGIEVITISGENYPELLKDCHDAPFILYLKGKLININKSIAVVGARKSTHYGEKSTQLLMEQLKEQDTNIVSGLAYGIDSYAHQYALQNQIPTTAVLAHGLDRIYPAQNRKLAQKILENGGLLTDYPIGTNPDRENFPKRNRIVAGMTQATVLVEAAKSGGALITADIADSYGREVFAVPGRITDASSEGCNNLIRYHKAQILTSGEHLCKSLGWMHTQKSNQNNKQVSLFSEMNQEEKKVVSFLKQNGIQSQQIIALQLNLPINKVAAQLFNLELNGVVKSLPGNCYDLC